MIQVHLNDDGEIVGDEYHILASAVGCLARVGCAFPITDKNWRKVKPTSKENVWKEVVVSDSLYSSKLLAPLVIQSHNS